MCEVGEGFGELKIIGGNMGRSGGGGALYEGGGEVVKVGIGGG